MKVLLGATLFAILALSGCNTVAGVGEDLSGVARTTQSMVGGRGSY